jgi:uncharacterized RDD family membrane protein YckC
LSVVAGLTFSSQAVTRGRRKAIMESNEAKIYSFPNLKKKFKSEVSKKRSRRINSFLTDLFFIQVFQKLAIFAFINFVDQSLFVLPFSVRSRLQGNVAEMSQATFILCFFGYYLVSSYLFEGLTLGKTIFGLRVVDKDSAGEQISFKKSLLRSIGYTSSLLMIVIPLAPISKLGSGPVFLYFLFVLTLLATSFRKMDHGFQDLLSQTEVMTDEQYEQFLIDQSSVESKTAQESDFSQAPEGPVEQLDLFAA